jgi:hypothetical protein
VRATIAFAARPRYRLRRKGMTPARRRQVTALDDEMEAPGWHAIDSHGALAIVEIQHSHRPVC